MASVASDSTPSLTPSRSPSPIFPVQPDHFYSAENNPPSQPSTPTSGRSWLSPDDDPLATRGIPVFKPTLDEFRDFEGYMNSIESWGMRSGIVKVIPPKEWTESLPSLAPQLANVRIKKPIEQHMFGRAGLFRQENIEKRNLMSVREWAELCAKEDFMAPGVDDVALKVSGNKLMPKKKRARRGESVKEQSSHPETERGIAIVKEEDMEEELMGVAVDHHGQEDHGDSSSPSLGRSQSNALAESPLPNSHIEDHKEEAEGDGVSVPTSGRKRRVQTRADREAAMARRDQLNDAYLSDFDPHTAWLPPNTKPSDYTPEFCAILERRYWRNCGLGKPPWYGADSAGSLFTDETTSWNVAHLPSTLSRLIPSADSGLPGVNMPYLYFGMWRATFAWHVEDMDLFSINYIHFGAPKHWYAIPQGRAPQLENCMRSFFPRDTSKCRQFLRHKSFLASPNVLQSSACKPNVLVQHAGEFVITYPRGYHAGFNLGFNCAESINFALESWLDIGRKAQVCGCVGDSVRIDVDELLRAKEERDEMEAQEASKPPSSTRKSTNRSPRKRKVQSLPEDDPAKPSKKARVKVDQPVTDKPRPTVMLKFSMPKDMQPFPCCLCISRDETGLLPVHGIPSPSSGHSNHLIKDEHGNAHWRAHESCALIIPETWVDEVPSSDPSSSTTASKKRMVFGVDVISKDRWNLKCSVCQKTKHKAHGAPIQCTKGKCPKAFHISCAKDDPDHRIQFTELREVLKDVLVNGETPLTSYPEIPNDMNSMSQSFKSVRKIEYELLCAQHNPVVAAAKKASKQDRVRAELLKLPEMARIKLRVTSGVFEVSLVRVIEDRNAVEVLWDGGIRKEFSWNSVVWGTTGDGQQIGQKPSVMAEQQMASSLSIINSAQPIPRITLPRNGPVASSSAQAGPSSQYQTVGHPSSASHSVMHAYPHAPPYTHAPNPHAPHQLLNATSSHSPYSVPAAAPPPYHSGHPAGPYPAFSYGHGVGTGTYSYYSSYGQPYLYHQQGPAQAYGHVSAPVPATQVQPYGYGPQGYPVLTVPLRPLQPIPVSGTVVVGERRRTPVGTNAHGNGNGNQKARFATFHVSDPASLAARYGHNRPDTSGTSSKDRSQSSKPEIAQPITTPTSGVPQVNTSMSNSRPAVQQSQPISTMTTPITPINVTPFSEIPSNLIAERSFQTAPQPTSTPTLSEFHAAAKQLEVLGADAGTNALDPARLEAVLENRPELREAAKMLLTYGQARTETQDK